MPERVIKDEQPRVHFNCSKCPAYCCSIYERVTVTKRDINRLAKFFKCTYEEAEERYTTTWEDERVLKRVDDVIFQKTCMFLDQKTRGCTIYEGRPKVCREFPGRPRCAYYDLVQFERRQQDDESVIPVVHIIFRETDEVEVHDKDSSERIYEWGEKEDKGAEKDSLKNGGEPPPTARKVTSRRS